MLQFTFKLPFVMSMSSMSYISDKRDALLSLYFIKKQSQSLK